MLGELKVVHIVFIVLVLGLSIIGLFTSKQARIFYKRTFLKNKLKKSGLVIDIKNNPLIDIIHVSKGGINIIKILNSEGEFIGKDNRKTWNIITRKGKRDIQNPNRFIIEAKDIIKNELDIECYYYTLFNFGKTDGVVSDHLLKLKDLNILNRKEIYNENELNELFNKLSDSNLLEKFKK